MNGLIRQIGQLADFPVVLRCLAVCVLTLASSNGLLANSPPAVPQQPLEQLSSTDSNQLGALATSQAVDNIDEELIYLDAQGTIHVLDTSPGAHGELTWQSPESGFIDVASGDFNLDGDHEVVGIKNVNNQGRIVIYDPVITDTDNAPDGWFGDVPWRKLTEIQTSGALNMVDAGELDTFFPGDEILYGMALDTTRTGIRIITGDSQSPDGTSWRTHIDPNFDWRWDAVAIGNIDGEATDEVVLMGSQAISNVNTSLLHFYRVNTPSLQSKAPFASQDRTSIRWRSAVIGEVKNLGPQEVVVVGDSINNASDNIHVFNYTPSPSGGIMDYADGKDREFVSPNPLLAFLADVTGIVNNQRDEEIFFLRSVPASTQNVPRFFARNQGNDGTLDTAIFDLTLDSDNGWQGGVGADVDGDGKDEIALMRDTQIRIYTEPDSPGQNGALDSTEYLLNTDGSHIIAANLDASGAQPPKQFAVTATGLENGLQEDSTGEFLIAIDSDSSIAFTASLVTPPGWVKSLVPLSGQSPTELALAVDSTGLNPGRYTTLVRVTTTDAYVKVKQTELEIELNVLTDSFAISPAKVNTLYFPCEAPYGLASTNVAVSSSANVAYTAVVLAADAVSAAELLLDGPVVAASLSGDSLSFFDEAGNSSELALPRVADDVSASQVDAAAGGIVRWRSSVPWIFARSATGIASETIELFFDPEKLVADDLTFGQATLLVLADEDVVDAPFNVRSVPIEFLCANNVVLLPFVQQ